jgi:PAS domain S-box-containing protein
MRNVQNTSRSTLAAQLFWLIIYLFAIVTPFHSQTLPTMFQNLQVNVLLIDSQSVRIIDANPKALDFYGYTREELLGQPISLVNTADEEITLKNIQRAHALEQTHFLFTHRLANGEHRIVEIYTSPITESDQNLLVSIILDVTDRIENEQSLITSQALLERAEEITMIGHWEIDFTTLQVYGSAGAFRIYGLDEQDLTLSQVQQIALPQYREPLDQALENLIHRNIPYLVEFRIRRPRDNVIRTIRSRATFDPVLNRMFGTIQDITADVALRQSQLLAARTSILFFLTTSLLLLFGIAIIWKQNTVKRHQNIKITHLLQEKELLLKEVHHRIKNHIGSAISLLNLQADQAQESNPEVAEHIQKALSTASSRLTSMMLIYDKLYKSEYYTAGSSKLYLESLSRELVQYLSSSKEILLETHIADVQLDPKILMSLGLIVNEMITNAMKYAFQGKTAGSIGVSLLNQQDSLILEVYDNGIGVDLEKNPLGTSKGFGWTLIQLTVEQLQGTYTLMSDQGFGIRIEIPR